ISSACRPRRSPIDRDRSVGVNHALCDHRDCSDPLLQHPGWARDDDEVKKERNKLKGTWIMMTKEDRGRETDVYAQNDVKRVMTAEKINWIEGGDETLYEFTIGPSGQPKEIDLHMLNGPRDDVFYLDGKWWQMG